MIAQNPPRPRLEQKCEATENHDPGRACAGEKQDKGNPIRRARHGKLYLEGCRAGAPP